MGIKKQYFTFQIAVDNTNQFEIVFNPNGVDNWYSSTNPQAICEYFKIGLEDYFKAAEKYGAEIYRAADKNFVPYDAPRFTNKKNARQFISEYLAHYVTVAQLMGNITK